VQAAPAPTGPAVQQAPPADMPRPARTGGPILPPLMAPQPSWKQEVRAPENAPEAPAAEPKPGDSENKG
jgi:hypothetical protein